METMTKGRAVAAIVAGAVSGEVVIALLEALSMRGASPPPFDDEAAFAAYVANLPTSVFVTLLGDHVAGALVAAGVATVVAKRSRWWPAMVVAGLLTVGAIVNGLSFPHPTWFLVADTVVYLPIAFVLARAMRTA